MSDCKLVAQPAILASRYRADYISCMKVFIRDNRRYLITASRNKSLTVYDLDTKTDEYPSGIPVKVLTGHSHFVSAVDVAADGIHAVSASWDGQLRIWDLVEGTCIRRINVGEKDLLTVTFANNDKTIICGGRSNSLYSFAIDGKKLCEKKDLHRDWIQRVSVLPGKTLRVATASWDRVVKVLEVDEKGVFTHKCNYTGLTGFVNVAVATPDGKTLFAAGKDGRVFGYDLEALDAPTPAQVEKFSFNTNMVVNDLIFDTRLFRVYVVGETGLQVWDLTPEGEANKAAEVAIRASEDETPVKGICAALSSNNIYVGGSDGRVFVYSIE